MFTHILVPLDGSELAECVLPHVILQATAMGAEVTLFHSLERQDQNGSSSAVHPVEWHMRRVQAQGYLEQVSRKMKASIPGVKTALVEGSAAESINVRCRRKNRISQGNGICNGASRRPCQRPGSSLLSSV